MVFHCRLLVSHSRAMLHTLVGLYDHLGVQIDLYETEQGQWSRPAPMEGEMRVSVPRRRHPLSGDHSRPLLDGVFANSPRAFKEASSKVVPALVQMIDG